MHKHRSMTFKRFAARLTEMKKPLPLFPGSDSSKKITPEEPNEVLQHGFPNAWVNKSYIQGWAFEMKTYMETCAMFEQMEISEQV